MRKGLVLIAVVVVALATYALAEDKALTPEKRIENSPFAVKRGSGLVMREQRRAEDKGLLGPHSAIRGANLKDCLLELDGSHGIVTIRVGQTDITIFADDTISVVRWGKVLFAEGDRIE